MNSKLHWFTVKQALVGVPETETSEAVTNLQAELRTRPHLRNTQTFWEAENQCVIVQVDTEGLDINSVSRGMAEELLEIVSAIFVKAEGIRVETLSASSLERS